MAASQAAGGTPGRIEAAQRLGDGVVRPAAHDVRWVVDALVTSAPISPVSQ